MGAAAATLVPQVFGLKRRNHLATAWLTRERTWNGQGGAEAAREGDHRTLRCDRDRRDARGEAGDPASAEHCTALSDCGAACAKE